MRTINISGLNSGPSPDFNFNPNLNLSYEIELRFESETIDVSEKDKKNLAAQNFLRLLRKFRTILLQNSVIIRFQFFQYLI
jgi:hypothetical protein